MDIFQVASLLGVAGWAGLIIKAIIDRKSTAASIDKSKAETQAIITKTATDMLTPMTQQIMMLREQLTWAKGRIQELTDEVKELNTELDRAYATIKELKRHVQ